jgi:alcohol dehydrogenase (cytochrome c)
VAVASAVALACLLLVPVVSAGGVAATGDDWALPNHDLSSTRADETSGIDRDSVASLHLAWRFPLTAKPGESGSFTATPVVAAGVVYVQDLLSNVFALDLATGARIWEHRFSDTDPGPNGVVVVGNRVYGATDTTVFALATSTGRVIWRRRLVTSAERFIDVAPQVANGDVYISTIGLPPDGKGALYAVSARTGRVRWRLSTVKNPWRVPDEAGGGGAWYPPSVDATDIYWGTQNPYPYGGTRAHPNGGAFAGDALYTDSLLAVSPAGRISWYDQVTPHDVRDYDFQLPPVLATLAGRDLLFGAGKAGIVIAWDRATHQRLWQVAVGEHRNDRGPLPAKRTTVCPGLLGGVETPMAYAGGQLFVPIVDLCMRGGAAGYENLADVDVARRGHGELVALDAATGSVQWTRRLPQPVFSCATVAHGVVFSATYDGTVYAFDTTDGTLLWTTRVRDGTNSCPSLAGTTLLVGSGVPRAGGHAEIAAYVTNAPAAP